MAIEMVKVSKRRLSFAAVLTVIFSLYSTRTECQYGAKERQAQALPSVWIQIRLFCHPLMTLIQSLSVSTVLWLHGLNFIISAGFAVNGQHFG